MRTIYILKIVGLACLSAILLSSCSAKQANQLLNHKNELSKIASSKSASPEQKMDVLMTNMVTMMHEGMRIVNPKKGVKYVTQFGKENNTSINQIVSEVGAWQKDLNTVDKIAMGARMLTKPYMKDALALIPKFVNKYKQVAFVSKTIGGLKQKVLGGDVIGNGLKNLGF